MNFVQIYNLATFRVAEKVQIWSVLFPQCTGQRFLDFLHQHQHVFFYFRFLRCLSGPFTHSVTVNIWQCFGYLLTGFLQYVLVVLLTHAMPAQIAPCVQDVTSSCRVSPHILACCHDMDCFVKINETSGVPWCPSGCTGNLLAPPDDNKYADFLVGPNQFLHSKYYLKSTLLGT